MFPILLMLTVCIHRKQVERNAGGSNQSRRPANPERAQETAETRSNPKSEDEAVVNNGRRPSDGKNAHTAISQTGQPRTIRSSGNRGEAARESEDEKEGSGTEHDPLIAPGGAEGKFEEDDNNTGGAGRNSSEDIQEEQDTPVETSQKTGGDDETSDTLRASADGLLEGAAGGDGGRFQGMRSRMKKAGKGLLPKKNPASSARRRKETEDAAPVGVDGKDEERLETAGGTSSGDILPDAGGKSTAREAGGGDRNDDGGGEMTPGGQADDSDTARCACPCPCCFLRTRSDVHPRADIAKRG